MPVAVAGAVFPWQIADGIGEDLSEIAFQWRFINECPLSTRMRQRPSRAQEFRALGSHKRPQTVQVIAAAAAADTLLRLADASYVMNGDTFELRFADNTVEQIEVVGDPDLTNHTIQTVRGDAGTAPGNIPLNGILHLIGNSRTGGEEFQRGIAPLYWRRANWVQNYNHPVKVTGLLQDTEEFRAQVVAEGAVAPLDAYRMRALQNTLEDQERSFIYQRGMAPTDSDTERAKTKGFRQQCEEAGTLNRQPTNFAAYRPRDFLRDLTEGPATANPDVIMISKDWVYGLADWKMGLVSMDMGETEMNVTINAFRSPIHDATFVINEKLRPGSLFAFRDEQVLSRYMRQPTYYNLAKNGDTWPGIVIARTGAQLDYPEEARFIEGVTGWTPT